MIRKLLLLALLSTPLFAQVVQSGYVTYVTSAPSGSCSQNNRVRVVMGAGTVYSCQSGTWAAVGGSSGVTSITGTANQITVTGTTTPTLSIPSAFVAPGSVTATTVFVAPVGTAGAPSITFAGNTATGMYNVSGQVVLTGGASAGAGWAAGSSLATAGVPGSFFTFSVPLDSGTATPVRVSSGSGYGFTASASDATASADTAFSRISAGVVGVGNGTAADVSGTIKPGKYATGTNCSNAAAPAVCASAASGVVAVPTGVNPTLTINTTAITATSRILLQIDESATIAATTCNTTLTTLVQPVVTARTAATSFTIQIGATLATNPACVSYFIVN